MMVQLVKMSNNFMTLMFHDIKTGVLLFRFFISLKASSGSPWDYPSPTPNPVDLTLNPT